MTRPRAASPKPKAEAPCSGCTDKAAEIRRLKRELAERGRASRSGTAPKGSLAEAVERGAAKARGALEQAAARPFGHAVHCQCIGCRQERA